MNVVLSSLAPLALLLVSVISLTGCGADSSDGVTVWFCPEDGCKDRLVEQIDRAEHTLVAAVFTFTHYDIAEAIARAVNERGVQAWVVVEEKQLDGGIQSFFTSRNIAFRLDSNPQLMHHKFTVIDDHTVCTGSFNYTNQADTKNDENLVIIESSDTALRFFEAFQELWDRSIDP
jgi:phosphatidylserine/phosphatidylglycerophosphate/cardiolipin synthase-like enzyme